MRKRLLALLLAAAMTAALAACGGNSGDGGADAPETGVETGAEDAAESAAGDEAAGADTGDDVIAAEPAAPDEAETGEPAPEGGSLPADTAQKPEGGNLPADAAQKPEAQPAQQLPASKPESVPETQEPASAGSSVDLTAFYETVTADGETWPAMMQMEGEVLDAFYPGLSDVAVNQCGVYTAMISAAVGEIALVEVQSAGDVQTVKDIFQARIDYQVGDDENPGGAWYPASIEGWKTGSRIVSNGNYIMLVALSEGADGVADSFNALFA